MPEKVNEDDPSVIELRRRNLKAAELLGQWIKAAEADDDQTDWSVFAIEYRDNAPRRGTLGDIPPTVHSARGFSLVGWRCHFSGPGHWLSMESSSPRIESIWSDSRRRRIGTKSEWRFLGAFSPSKPKERATPKDGPSSN
jgi:hypothetical protein